MSVTLCKFATHKIPAEVLQNGCDNNTHVSVAFAQMEKNKAPAVLVLRQATSVLNADALGKLQEAHKDKDIILHFETYPEGYDSKNHQPHVLLWNQDNRPLLVAFLQGIDDPADEVKTYLLPKAVSLLDAAGQDPVKLVAKLNESMVMTEITSSVGIGETSSITMVAGCHKEPIAYHPNTGNDTGDFDWGWTTQRKIDTKEGVPVTTKVTAEDALLASLGIAPEPAKPHSHIASVEPIRQPGDTDNHEVYTPPVGMRFRQFADHMKKRGQDVITQEDWAQYKLNKYTAMVPKAKSILKDLRDLAQTVVPAKETVPARPDVPATPKPDQKPAEAAPPANPERNIPVLNPAQRAALEPIMRARNVGMLDANSEQIMHPDVLPDFTQEMPRFTEQMKLPSVFATLHWQFKDYAAIAGVDEKGKPTADFDLHRLVCYIFELKHELLDRSKELYRLKNTGKAPVATGQPPMQQVPAQQAAGIGVRRRGPSVNRA